MDIEGGIFFQFLLSFCLGALIGMERGITKQGIKENKEFSGFGEIRTFSLISFLGALSAFIGNKMGSEYFIIFSFVIISLFIMCYYIYGVFRKQQFGITTELSALVTFFLGVFVMIGYSHLAIILSILITFLLSSKFLLQDITEKISEKELINTLKFAIIAIVILPLLSNEKYSLQTIFQFLGFEESFSSYFFTVDFLNPYGIWFFVVLMSGISYIGYLMSKFISEKSSILASGAIGGLISSTAVTASMTEKSINDIKNTDMYVVSTLLASTIMFVRVIIIVLFFNINIFPKLIIPSICMFLGMIVYMYYFYKKGKKITYASRALGANKGFDSKRINKILKKNKKKHKLLSIDIEKEKVIESPFKIGPAIKFALFVLLIKFVSAIGGAYKDIWGDYFFYAIGVISGLADVDAISQTMAVDSLDKEIPLGVASITIIIAIISNNLVKGTIAFRFGEKRFGRSVLVGFLFSMCMGIIGLICMSMI